jgi:hypothetical protein
MKQLRFSLLALVVTLTFFFNIERIDYHNHDLINVSSDVYVLVMVASIVSLFSRNIPRIGPIGMIISWQALYFLVNVFFLRRGLQENLIYVYITEVTFLSLIVYLSLRIREQLMEFEEAVETLTFDGLNRPNSSVVDSMQDLQDQMNLCRRHDRPLSVIVVKPDAPARETLRNQAVLQVQQAMMSRYATHRVLRALDQQLRRTDVLLHNTDGSFVIVCPETNGSHLQTLLDRISFSVRDQLGVSVSCGAASFPDKALTFEELLAIAEGQMRDGYSSSAPASRPAQSIPKPKIVSGANS